ncbi:Homeobox protein Hox-D12 [Thelohanellus kitauei]|uniref:Homeobox protein Hox-D12 n=1 Tax=Thelohanellus kitauei TaxID=669202 RepID=A0A0C2MBS6_THEKT|nr:Homeobox protein Hox-D12 [Thelohanellus kitauei]
MKTKPYPQSIAHSTLQYYDRSFGNYFRVNPTFLTDQGMIELMTIDHQDSGFALDDIFEEYSPDVVVNGCSMSDLNNDEPQNNQRNIVMYDTCGTTPAMEVSANDISPCICESTSSKLVDISIKKSKQKEKNFTTQQLSILERCFKVKPYLNRQDKAWISEFMGVSGYRIQRWWQNKRNRKKRSLAYVKPHNLTNVPPMSDVDSAERKNEKDSVV